MIVSNAIKKRFCSDFKLPINIFQEPYYQYFIDLYNKDYEIDKKIVLLNEVLDSEKEQEAFLSYSYKLSDSVKKLITDSNAYELLNNADMNKDFPLIDNVRNQSIYIQENIGKRLISIDLKQANYNCLDLFGIKNELGANSYKELIEKYTDFQYYVESKKIRQVIFGDLNPKRQQRIQKYIIGKLCNELLKNGLEFTFASSDEIILKDTNVSVNQIKELLSKLPEKYQFYRVEEFSFKQIDDINPYYIKETLVENGDIKKEFKNIPSHFFAQVYKKYNNLEVNEYDLMFYHEDMLASFKEKLYDNPNNIKTKRKTL